MRPMPSTEESSSALASLRSSTDLKPASKRTLALREPNPGTAVSSSTAFIFLWRSGVSNSSDTIPASISLESCFDDISLINGYWVSLVVFIRLIMISLDAPSKFPVAIWARDLFKARPGRSGASALTFSKQSMASLPLPMSRRASP